MAAMNRAAKRRLNLATETLRTLWAGALDHVHGGGAITDQLFGNSGLCVSRICSIGRDCKIGGDGS
jgi:hypothetical protein